MHPKDYGIGLGLRSIYLNKFEKELPKPISWIEVITENYISHSYFSNEAPIQKLEKIAAFGPIAFHGVSLSLGSKKVSTSYLKKLKNLTERIPALSISDHVCFSRVGKTEFHDLLPLPFTTESCQIMRDNILTVQDFLKHRILIENVSSYFTFKVSSQTEWDFINTLLKEADCGLLLDINNVYVNSVNHSFDPYEYLKNIDAQRVYEIHLAGHTRTKHFLIDTHDHRVSHKVWDLFSWFTQHHGKRSTLLEWDDKFPSWPVIMSELCKIKKIRERSYETKNLYPSSQPHFSLSDTNAI